MADEYCKDFHTGESVLRFQYRPSPKPCAKCGAQVCHYDAKYGWHLCTDHDPNEFAAEFARDVVSTGGIF